MNANDEVILPHSKYFDFQDINFPLTAIIPISVGVAERLESVDTITIGVDMSGTLGGPIQNYWRV